ncbi:isopeptide-forming domain-containing fimbrial protein [Salipaludibacillus agaradhaerens]|uniref:isopeptide-forming domain-containing fimbrial protein n=1 Tax=Salipaludibacillus agaradhaerens TaxID=76935 RepID=UPI002150C93B|nr:isopeptide-forming domain-containing fimbrial protein [Salipaludibacillus agaradhaerens]MCR6108704.1 isopeptide-forming domain-containing fimbrial protein [Salipaludibacillus agaradhaerens]MCR6120727.1 isopeptide-forming domain-containing fimbrial protein [Salipaludibacillus agaradhaerens]
MRVKRKARLSFQQMIAITMLLALGGVFVIDFGSTAYADISRAPGYEVANSNTTIPEQYNFVPRVTRDTQIETFGSSHWRTLDTRSRRQANPIANPKYFGIDLRSSARNSLKGNIGVRYTNVGYVDGRSVDLKITLMDWTPYGRTNPVTTTLGGESDSVGNISFRKNEIAMDSQGYETVDMRWEYVRSGTNTRVNVSGYLTMSDIDIHQGIWFSPATTRNIDKIMVENNRNVLQYRSGNCGRGSSVSGSMCIYDTTGVDVPDDSKDPRYRFTILYSNRSHLDFTWYNNTGARNFNGSPVTRDRRMYTDVNGGAQGDYFFYEMDKPARTAVPRPKKSVSSSRFRLNQTYTYNIEHNVPMEDERFYYKNYRMVDTVDPVMRNLSVRVFNQAGNNVTSRFTTDINSNTVTVTAKSSWLNREDFYGETYRVEIQGRLHESRTLNAIGNNDSYTIKNRATVTVDGRSYRSNEVESKAHRRKISIRHVDEETDELLASSVDYKLEGSSYEYKHRNDLKFKEDLLYRVVGDKSFSGTVGNRDITLTFYYERPRALTVRHIDKDSGEVLDSSVTYKHRGKSYEFEYRDDLLYRDKYPYYVVGDKKHAGTVTEDATLDFYYKRPAADLGLEKLTIKTNLYDKGLPTKIEYKMEPLLENQWQEQEVRIVITESQSDRKVYDEEHTLEAIMNPSSDSTMPEYIPLDNKTDDLKEEAMANKADKGAVREYTVTIEPVDARTVFISPDESSIMTEGTTSYYNTWHIDSQASREEHTKTGVYMTSRVLGEDMQTYYETITVDMPETARLKTGYGFEHEAKVTYQNDAKEYGTPTTSMVEVPYFHINGDIINGPYDPVNDGGISVAVPNAGHVQEDEEQVVSTFMFDRIALKSGLMMRPEGQEADDSFVLLEGEQDAPEGYMNGDRRVFIDPWVDDSYVNGSQSDVSYTTDTDYLGGNWRNVVMERHIDITAYMFNHTDSDTHEDDELLVHPILQDDIPDEW